MDVMSGITKIATVETSTAIWEYDLALPSNQVLGGLLDVISAIRTLAIKIQASGQCIVYFEHVQTKCSITTPLTIPLHSNIHWGTMDGMLGCSYHLCQPIDLFVCSADELFGPIKTIQPPGQPVKNIPWMAFIFKASDLEYVNNTCSIISDANNIQHIFSHKDQATLWCVIPAFEELQTSWEVKLDVLHYMLYKDAIQQGLMKIGKYYNKFNDKPVYVLALILHPYHKLAYIKMAWGGLEEQQKEHEAGKFNAKDWYDEALQIIEKTMEEYWNSEHQAAAKHSHGTAMTAANENNNTPESEFNCYHCELLKQERHKDGGGWKAELQCYISDLPTDVSKDTDIVQWWGDHATLYPTLT
ncbi:hypothetical protein PAXRUDRAFT_16219 [Paxillus rubicundulus Ve08.2h10]|uniref:Uncharacterized protein n=1 Tax=Paxillus rubicundulus Ve08.2h10 TaxID=930991 RepID=A0A0D0DF72_9AGAM|nr:hypothetical protein PAXRUDRAFT_16219 [Paxillus rubicundulus Ve08.2h10]